jgi:hypothetical protein
MPSQESGTEHFILGGVPLFRGALYLVIDQIAAARGASAGPPKALSDPDHGRSESVARWWAIPSPQMETADDRQEPKPSAVCHQD